MKNVVTCVSAGRTVALLCLVSGALASPTCPGDADGSGFVDFDDLNTVLLNWGTSVTPGTSGDEDGDGDVDFDDLNAVLGAWATTCPTPGVIARVQLAGHALAAAPGFDWVRAFNVGQDFQVAINPARHPDVIGATFDIYVQPARSAMQWASDMTLTDVRPLPQTETVTGGTIADATFTILQGNFLPGDAGTGIGVGYDIILDMNRNGVL
ncbi:MAG: hypothetical protein KDA21_02820, partial [Phycisphaerales bacterium]|nr:hypothetical protein [Phycisphaerales bacterium]